MCDAALPLVNSTLFSCPNFLSREFWNLVFHATPRCGAVSSSMYGDGLTPITFSDGLGVGPADVQVQRFKYYGAAQFFPHFMRPRCCTGGPTIYGDGRYGLSGYGVPKTVLMMDTVTPRSCRRPCEGRQGRGGAACLPASRCGFTPQYKGLQALQEKYAGKPFSVVAFPCNQFGGQEPAPGGGPIPIDLKVKHN